MRLILRIGVYLLMTSICYGKMFDKSFSNCNLVLGRLAMKPGGKGVVFLNTENDINKQLGARIHEAGGELVTLLDSALDPGSSNESVRESTKKKLIRLGFHNEFVELQKLIEKLSSYVRNSVSSEEASKLRLSVVNLTWQPWGHPGFSPHEDGASLIVTTALLGPGTIYVPPDINFKNRSSFDDVYSATPPGYSLLFNGINRQGGHPITHSAPSTYEPRLVLILEFNIQK